MQPHRQHRYIHFINNGNTRASIVQNALADNIFFHRFGQCIPCAEVSPSACETNHLDLRFMFYNRIIEGDFFQRIILSEQVGIIGEVHQLMRLIHHIAQFVGKHAAVPKCALRNILLGNICRRFLFESLHCRHMVGAFWDDITVFLAGIGRFNAHQHKICFALISLIRQFLQGFKIGIFHIRIDRADNYGFRWVNVHHIN